METSALPGIAGRVALVTGAARRRSIGRATALRLAAEGAAVACLDIAAPMSGFAHHATASSDELHEVVEAIRAAGGDALAVVADVTDEDAVEAAVTEVSSTLGMVTLLANVAGGTGLGLGFGPLVGLPERELTKVVDVNLTGSWLLARAVARRLLAGGEPGRIVNVSSQAGKVGWPALGAYSAANAGVILLTQVLARELGPHGITVNAVCPGTVDTDLLNAGHGFELLLDATEPGGRDAWLAREVPLGRMQQPEEVAAAIAFLCSDDAAYITGEAMNVSGGQTVL